MKKQYLYLMMATLTALYSCKDAVYSDYKSIDQETGWKKDAIIRFETEIKDTQTPHDVYINIRQADSYPYRNLFLFLHTTYPDGKRITDTLECLLANEKGEWLGKGAGDLWDNSILFKKNTVFPQTGKYTFAFEQAMRYGDKNNIDPLPFILDIGITINKSKN